MITGCLLEAIYEAASIQRWNDHIRPSQGFTELDKQAHKMVFAYVLGKFEETEGKTKLCWIKLIEGGLFEFLHRIRLTDIKPPVFHRLMKEKGDDLNNWVLNKYKEELTRIDAGLFHRFETYLKDSNYASREKQILKAAHYLATNWEFKIIYRLNLGLYGLDKEKDDIEHELDLHSGLVGVQKVALNKNIRSFMDLVGQLRFQQRWGQSPRIPQTSVLGHMLIVAILSYFCCLHISAGPRRTYNNYFCGLLHDLPEVLTRDIVSPVKKAVEDLDTIIKDIEKEEANKRLYPLLPLEWQEEIRYLIEDEFRDRVRINGRRHNRPVSGEYEADSYDPVDGSLIKACDSLAAYVEAFLSLQHGVKSSHLKEGLDSIYREYAEAKITGVDFSQVFRHFAPSNLA